MNSSAKLAPLTPAFRAMIRDRLCARAQKAGLDGLLLLAPGNVGYASGWKFSIHERPMGLWLPVGGEPTLFVPHLELENAMDVPGVTVRTYEEFPGVVPPVLWMIGETRSKRLGIDALDAQLLAPAQELARIDLADHVLDARAVAPHRPESTFVMDEVVVLVDAVAPVRIAHDHMLHRHAREVREIDRVRVGRHPVTLEHDARTGVLRWVRRGRIGIGMRRGRGRHGR